MSGVSGLFTRAAAAASRGFMTALLQGMMGLLAGGGASARAPSDPGGPGPPDSDPAPPEGHGPSSLTAAAEPEPEPGPDGPGAHAGAGAAAAGAGAASGGADTAVLPVPVPAPVPVPRAAVDIVDCSGHLQQVLKSKAAARFLPLLRLRTLAHACVAVDGRALGSAGSDSARESPWEVAMREGYVSRCGSASWVRTVWGEDRVGPRPGRCGSL
jgi:hypothetical protein